MKSFVITMLLLLSPLGASANTDHEVCLKASVQIFFAATGRDLGSSPKGVIEGLLKNGMPKDGAMAIGKLIFVDAPDKTPAELAERFFIYCTSEAA